MPSHLWGGGTQFIAWWLGIQAIRTRCQVRSTTLWCTCDDVKSVCLSKPIGRLGYIDPVLAIYTASAEGKRYCWSRVMFNLAGFSNPQELLTDCSTSSMMGKDLTLDFADDIDILLTTSPRCDQLLVFNRPPTSSFMKRLISNRISIENYTTGRLLPRLVSIIKCDMVMGTYLFDFPYPGHLLADLPHLSAEADGPV